MFYFNLTRLVLFLFFSHAHLPIFLGLPWFYFLPTESLYCTGTCTFGMRFGIHRWSYSFSEWKNNFRHQLWHCCAIDTKKPRYSQSWSFSQAIRYVAIGKMNAVNTLLSIPQLDACYCYCFEDCYWCIPHKCFFWFWFN